MKKYTVVDNGKPFLKGIEKTTTSYTRSSGKRVFNQIRFSVLNTLSDCIQKRFKADAELIQVLEPFIQFKENANGRKIHSMFGADLPLVSMSPEFDTASYNNR